MLRDGLLHQDAIGLPPAGLSLSISESTKKMNSGKHTRNAEEKEV